MIHSKLALVVVLAGPTSIVYGQLNCTNFTQGNDACTDPRAINPADACTELPNCPVWCNETDDNYCSAKVINGANVSKYMTEFFAPPVLVNSNGKKKGHAISTREFLQQILPEHPPTRLWGYGDSKFFDDEITPISFHNPAGTVEAKQNVELNIAFFNDLVEDPDECRCSGDPDACQPLKHILQDCSGVPVVDTALHWSNPGGPNLDIAVCAHGENLARTDCTGKYTYVYDGPVGNVAHVHGSHAAPESDGYTEAWFLPPLNSADASKYTPGGVWFETFGPTFTPKYQSDGRTCTAKVDVGYEANTYTNDQATNTDFYHDHTLGMTRLNVMATSAGFYFIRDLKCVYQNTKKSKKLIWYGESGIDDCENNILPGPPPTAELYTSQNPDNIYIEGIPNWYEKPPFADETIRELPIAIQDMSFYHDTDKDETRQFYPADHDNFLDEDGDLGPDWNADRWGCNNLNGNDAYRSQTPTVPHIWNPEVFFDVAVVNGRAWPKHKVRPNQYRLRLLNACDSRTLSISAWAVPSSFTEEITSINDLWDAAEDANSNVTERAIYIIGTEQGLLPGGPAKILSGGNNTGSVAKFNCNLTEYTNTTAQGRGLLMQPGERYDAIINFEGLNRGDKVYLVNNGPNEPYKTFDLVDQFEDGNRAPWNTLGQLMRFDVELEKDLDDISTPVEELCFSQNPGGVPKFDPEDPEVVVRKVYAKEEVTFGESLGPLAAVLDNECDRTEPDSECELEGKTWSMPITENVAVNKIEEWDVINLSADSHPIHLHQIKFEVVKRCQGEDSTLCEAGAGVYGYETGWKDAVIATPNFTTTIRMRFDILGIYVWHCHILSHEDNEMMRPLCVYDPAENDTLSNCCPDGQVYDSNYWNETSSLRCNITTTSSCSEYVTKKTCKKSTQACEWDSRKCVEKDPLLVQQMDVEEVPWMEKDSSSSRVELKISGVVGLFLVLWI